MDLALLKPPSEYVERIVNALFPNYRETEVASLPGNFIRVLRLGAGKASCLGNTSAEIVKALITSGQTPSKAYLKICLSRGDPPE